ncbi:MAG: response regulator, partial [Deltaproteobacteria bacterium]|nr:response regulator [Deltaproteobacteria bacterium]
GSELVRGGWYICLEVADNGGGIPPEVLPHIFEPFFTTKKVGEGTGLGLATVYGIVKQNQGDIRVESQPGRGAVFRVYWPLRPDLPAVAESINEVGPGIRTGRETILVAEDEDAARQVAGRTLEMAGYRVLRAADGRQALALLRENAGRVDLLFTDLVMPVMGGRELWAAGHQLYPGLKAIFTSGYRGDRLDPEDDFIKNGCFIQKPYAVPALLELVRRVLDGENLGQSVAGKS